MDVIRDALSWEPLDRFLGWKLPQFHFERGLGEASGMPLDHLRFMLAFFFSCVAGFILRHTPTATGRRLVSTITGVGLCYYAFGNGVAHGFVLTFLNWVVLAAFPGRACLLSWALNFPYLTACHIKAGDTWKRGELDFTGALMVLTLKMIALGTSREAGSRPRREKAAAAQAKDASVDQDQADASKAVSRSPGLFELLAFAFANGNLLGGPYFDWKDWDEFIRRSGPFREALETVDGKRPPSSTLAGVTKAIVSFLYLGVYIALSRLISLDLIFDPGFYKQPFYRKLALLWCIGLFFRLRFYFVWTLSEANLTIAGFGFNGWADEGKTRPKWDRLTNGYPLKIETADSVGPLMLYWNSLTSSFLRRHVYEKATFGRKTPGFASLMLTNVMSALWHGVEASYILLFGTAAVMVAVSRFIYQQERRLPSWIYKSFLWRLLKIAWTISIMNYSCLAFHLYDLSKLFKAWAQFDFIPHIILLGLAALSVVVPRPRHIKSSTAKVVEPHGPEKKVN